MKMAKSVIMKIEQIALVPIYMNVLMLCKILVYHAGQGTHYLPLTIAQQL